MKNCDCGAPTERYMPSVEEIREKDRGRREGASTTYAPGPKPIPLRRFDKWE